MGLEARLGLYKRPHKDLFLGLFASRIGPGRTLLALRGGLHRHGTPYTAH
jgi:hypothetical protein